jgi:hypothetical protein
MAFDPEQFELLNDYGIVISERTRRLIKRNNMKLELEQKEKEREKGNIIYNICVLCVWCVLPLRLCLPLIFCLGIFKILIFFVRKFYTLVHINFY